jgi:DNA polymerase III subunit beta
VTTTITPTATTTKKPRTQATAPSARDTTTPEGATAPLRISVPQATLKRGLKLVGHALAGSSTLPILANVLLASDRDRGLKLQATNLELGITVWLSDGVTVTSEGATTLTAKLLTDVVGALPEEVLTLRHDPAAEATTISCSRFETSMHGIAAADFPPIPTGKGLARTAVIDAELLRQAISQVALAAATDDTRPVLTGVLITLEAGVATFAAADGFRLARKTVTLAQPVQPRVATILPARALAKLGALLADVRGEVDITVTPNGGQVVFATPGLEVVTRVIDGLYPDIARVIPAQHTTGVALETAELAKAVKLAAYFAAVSSHIVRLTAVAGEAGQLTIAANAAEVGDNTGRIVAAVTGEGGQIALNAKFLTEALQAIGAANVRLELQSPRHPAVLKPADDASYVHIIMPMTVS